MLSPPRFKRLVFATALLAMIIVLVTWRDNRFGPTFHLVDYSSHIFLSRDTSSNLRDMVIDEHIVAYSYDSKFASFLRVVAITIDCRLSNGAWMLITHYTPEHEYYIIDKFADKLHGPLTKSQYIKLSSNLGIRAAQLIPQKEWTNTDSFVESIYKCTAVR